MAASQSAAEKAALEDRLKSTLWYALGQLVDAECLRLDVNATPQFIGALTEMVWAQLENVAHDLESFAKHAGRRTVGVEDVLLLTRRNEGLETLVREFVEGREGGKTATAGGGRERRR